MTFRNLVPWSSGRELGRRGDVSPFSLIQREMNDLFEDFARGFSPTLVANAAFSPKIDVQDEPSQLTVTAELPGLEEKDVDIQLTKEFLSIRGEKKQETEKKEGKQLFVERSYGSFERVVPLTAEIDEDKVEATFRKGVLHIKLPKVAGESRNTKKISIKS